MSTLVVLITGALIGIGRAAALAFAKGGSRVVISGRHEEAGQALATVLHALGAEAEFLPFTDPRLSIREPPFSDIQVRYVWNYGPFFKPLGEFICQATRKEVPDEF